MTVTIPVWALVPLAILLAALLASVLLLTVVTIHNLRHRARQRRASTTRPTVQHAVDGVGDDVLAKVFPLPTRRQP